MSEYSNCCGARRLDDESDICSDCLEHAEFDYFDPDERGDWLYHKRRDDDAEARLEHMMLHGTE